MDAIRKKMQSLKGETDTLYATIAKFEDDTREAVKRAEQVRDKDKHHICHFCSMDKICGLIFKSE